MFPTKSCAERDLLQKWDHCGLVSEDELSGVGAAPIGMILPAEEMPRKKELESGVRCSQAKEQVGPQSWSRQGRSTPRRLWKGHGPANTWILAFQPPDLQEAYVLLC